MKQVTTLVMFAALAFSLVLARNFAVGDPPPGEKPIDEKPVADALGDPQASPLDDLAWLAGQWVDSAEDSTVSTNCSWTQNHKFLTQSFRVTIDGKVGLEGVQKIGWDPIEKRIRSWIFDSEGGIGEGRWIKDGDRWEVKTTFTLASGERASSVNVYSRVDANTFRWQSIDREIGGEMQPNIPEVNVVRQKPGGAKSGQLEKSELGEKEVPHE